MPYCRECGGAVPEGSNFCEHCGADLRPDGEGAGGDDGQDPDADDAGGDGADDLWGGVDGPIDPGTHSGEGNDGSDDGSGRSGTGSGQPGPQGHEASGGRHPSSGGNRTQNYDQPRGATDRRQEGHGSSTDVGEDVVETNTTGPFPFDEGAVSFGLGYSTRETYVTVLLGGVLAVIPILNLVTQGYLFQLARAAGRGQATPPDFDDIGALFVDGLKFLALTIAWYFALIVGFVLVAVVGAAVGGPLGLVTGALLALVLIYALPAMLTVVAVTDDFGAAFSGEYVLAWIGTGHYLGAFLLSIVLWLLLGLLVVVSLITIVGVIFVAAWSNFVVAAYWGYKYREAVDRTIVPPAPAEPV